jgi:hypothetical protein
MSLVLVRVNLTTTARPFAHGAGDSDGCSSVEYPRFLRYTEMSSGQRWGRRRVNERPRFVYKQSRHEILLGHEILLETS